MLRNSTPETTSTPTDTTPVPGAVAVIEAPTAEAALVAVHERFGTDATVLEATSVLRGGVGGFFAKEHVQLHVGGTTPPGSSASGATGVGAGSTEGRPPAQPSPPSPPSPHDRLDDRLDHRLDDRFDGLPTESASATPDAEAVTAMQRLLGEASEVSDEVNFATFLRRNLAKDGDDQAATSTRRRASELWAAASGPTPGAAPPAADAPAGAAPGTTPAGEDAPTIVASGSASTVADVPAAAATAYQHEASPIVSGPAPWLSADAPVGTTDQPAGTDAPPSTVPQPDAGSRSEVVSTAPVDRCLPEDAASADAPAMADAPATVDAPVPADARAGSGAVATEPATTAVAEPSATAAPAPAPEPVPATPTHGGATERSYAPAAASSALTEDDPAWSETALLHLGFPVGLVHGLELDGEDDLAWTRAVAEAVRPLCRPMPGGDAVLVGPAAPALGEQLGLPTARSKAWLDAIGGACWTHLVVSDAPWRDDLATSPLAVSWTRPEHLPDALRCAAELGLVLGFGPLDGTIKRARPLSVALAARDLVGAR